jgi:hypothetical protein
MHILDFIMWFPCVIVLWGLIHLFSGGEFTEELGGLIGLFIEIVFTIIYFLAFVWPGDLNWIDIFSGKHHLFPHITW